MSACDAREAGCDGMTVVGNANFNGWNVCISNDGHPTAAGRSGRPSHALGQFRVLVAGGTHE